MRIKISKEMAQDRGVEGFVKVANAQKVLQRKESTSRAALH